MRMTRELTNCLVVHYLVKDPLQPGLQNNSRVEDMVVGVGAVAGNHIPAFVPHLMKVCEDGKIVVNRVVEVIRPMGQHP
jgi:hypothetical protein